ncbi:MAG: thioredoxin family protein [Chloroflexi bacterium]|nr:thioredoxin family protein [Chloroflexota bacterium]
MVSFVNRYSYLFTSAVAMLVAWVVGARFGGVWPAVTVGGVGVGLAVAQRMLRGGSSDVVSWRGVQEEIGQGQPTLLYLFSDNCGACLASRPIVDSIERELAVKLDVLRVNVSDDVGQEVRERYGIRMVPTVILLDREGVEQYRTEGRLPRKQAIAELVTGL